MHVQAEAATTGRPTVNGAASTAPTLLTELFPSLLTKFECNNPAASHKVRAARHIVRRGLESADIVPGRTTVIEKTGGNFGFGLALACAEVGVPVELAVGLGFSPIKRQCLEFFGAKLIGIEMLHEGLKPREVVEWHLANAHALGRSYFYTDQFSNIGSLEAHLRETGPEIVAQLCTDFPEVRRLTFIACAGTGASLTGVARSLQMAGYELDVVLVEPQGCDSRTGVFCDHPLEGMSVGVKPPFLDWSLIDSIEHVAFGEVVETQQMLSTTRGFFVGNTSAACLRIALQRCRALPVEHKVLAMIYDHGLWYLNTVFSAQATRRA